MEHNNRPALGQILVGALLSALFLSLIPNLDLPEQPRQPQYQRLSETDVLKVKLCTDVKRDFNNEDLNHFCKGVE